MCFVESIAICKAKSGLSKEYMTEESSRQAEGRKQECVEVHARSVFRFVQGAGMLEELIGVCGGLKMPSMAVLDRDGVYGAARFHLAGKKLGVKAHIGAEITVSSFKFQVSSSKPQQTVSVPLLVRSRAGYQNLCRLITLMKMRVPKHAKPGECAVTPDERAEHAAGLICLTGGSDGPLRFNHYGEAQRTTEWLIDVFGKGNVYAELQRHFNREEEARNHAVFEIAHRFKSPLLALHEASYVPRRHPQ